ncbi:MAG: hypothetical protein ACK5P5_02185 [Pseudobdellovibrionaceae bacterium]
MRRPFYAETDPFCFVRALDDQQYTGDHFYAKLFKTADTMKTEAGRIEALNRAEIMNKYLVDLGNEIS